MTSKLSVKLYKGNYKWVQNQLRLFAAYQVCEGAGSQEGIQEPWRGNSQAGSLPGPSTMLTCLSCPCRSGHFFQTTEHAALWLRCPQWQLCGSFWGLCLGCGTRAGSWFHDHCLSLGWWRSQRVTRPIPPQTALWTARGIQHPGSETLSSLDPFLQTSLWTAHRIPWSCLWDPV